MSTFNIVLTTIFCVFAFIGIVFIIFVKYSDYVADKEQEEKEQEDCLLRLKNNISANYHYFRRLEQKVVYLCSKVDCLEKKSKSLNKGKTKK